MKTEEGDTSSKEMSYLSSLLSTNFFVGSDVPYLSMEEDQRDGDKMSKDKSEEERLWIHWIGSVRRERRFFLVLLSFSPIGSVSWGREGTGF